MVHTLIAAFFARNLACHAGILLLCVTKVKMTPFGIEYCILRQNTRSAESAADQIDMFEECWKRPHSSQRWPVGGERGNFTLTAEKLPLSENSPSDEGVTQ